MAAQPAVERTWRYCAVNKQKLERNFSFCVLEKIMKYRNGAMLLQDRY